MAGVGGNALRVCVCVFVWEIRVCAHQRSPAFPQTLLVTVPSPQESPLNHKNRASKKKKRGLGPLPTGVSGFCVKPCVNSGEEIMSHVKHMTVEWDTSTKGNTVRICVVFVMLWRECDLMFWQPNRSL